jgi:cytochrome c-type biogenesis protein CcsB
MGFVIHGAGVTLRGIDAGRVPWANMYEFSITSTLIIIGIFLLMQIRLNIRFLGTFVVGLMLILLGVATVGFYVDAVPLPPALQSAWLVIHVLVAMTATAFFALSFAVSAIQIAKSGNGSLLARLGSTVKTNIDRLFRTLPDAEALDAMAYRIIIVGFILWTFTLMAGAIWANRAWGRYWGWDVKEVWTFIIWVIYAAYIHAKATRGWNGTRAAWLAIIGFVSVMFNFGVVNVFFKGLHSYSGL